MMFQSYILVSLCIFLAIADRPEPDYVQSFETDLDGWSSDGTQLVVNASGGTILPTHGLKFAQFPRACSLESQPLCTVENINTNPITTWWQPKNQVRNPQWIRGGAEASIDVYLDPAESVSMNGDVNGLRIEWTLDITEAGVGSALKRYSIIVGNYHGATCTSSPCFVFGTRSTDVDGKKRFVAAGTESNFQAERDLADPLLADDPIEIVEAGWYKFLIRIREENFAAGLPNDAEIVIEITAPGGTVYSQSGWRYTDAGNTDTLGFVGTSSFVNQFYPELNVDNARFIFLIADDCDDQKECTYDVLQDYQCHHLWLNHLCDDGDICTVDICNPTLYSSNNITGCTNKPLDCNDDKPCTIDTCNSTLAEPCVHTPKDCDDGFACTLDSCDETIGECLNIPSDAECNLPGGDLCQIGVCTFISDDEIGCVYNPKVCTDDIPCTKDLCNSTTGNCYFEEDHSLCDDSLPCTEDRCDSVRGGCTFTPKHDLCPSTPCADGFCSFPFGCSLIEYNCDDGIACTTDFCVDGHCLHVVHHDSCDDGIDCTDDECNVILGACTNIPNDIRCDDGDGCTVDTCDRSLERCVYKNKDCDDGIWCTEDVCENGQCTSNPRDDWCEVPPEMNCATASCETSLGNCLLTFSDTFCDDHDPCTSDTCGGDGQCDNLLIDCNDHIDCTIDYCFEGTCKNDLSHEFCDDSVVCTIDACDPTLGGCTNIPNNASCDDHVDCTNDYCDLVNGICNREPIQENCDDSISCTRDRCVPEKGCEFSPDDSLCDDGIPCTLDTCDPVIGCTHEPIHELCDDNVTCTDDRCDILHGCIIDPVHQRCDDNVECTRDICTKSGCDYNPRHHWCDDGVGCTLDECVVDGPTKGCSSTPRHYLCNDGRGCSIDTCTADGCVIDEEFCILKKDLCINCKGSVSRIAKKKFSDGNNEILLKTRNTATIGNAIPSSTEGLTTNLILRGTGQIFVGESQDWSFGGAGLTVGTNFKLIPSEDSLPTCNEVRRGTIAVRSESNGVDLEDHTLICLKTTTGYEWKLIA